MNDIRAQTVAVGILKAGGAVFTQRREGTGHLDGYLEFPGGKIRQDEVPLQALSRELREEIGFDLFNYDAEPFWVEHFAYPERKLELYFYLIELARLPAIGRGQWCLIESLNETEFPPANKQVILKLKKLSKS